MEREIELFNFEKLNVYQKALDFVDCIYNITSNFPKEERFILIDQFRRASISIALNIAEGYGGSNLEFKRYLKISKGSIRESVAITALAIRRKYIDKTIEQDIRNKCIELSKMLSGLIKTLN